MAFGQEKASFVIIEVVLIREVPLYNNGINNTTRRSISCCQDSNSLVRSLYFALA